MPRFFLPSSDISGDTVTLRGEDARHVARSLRMRSGERIIVCDMRKIEYECELCEVLPELVTARILSSRESDTEPPYHILLCQALPKSDKLDTIIQKAVESGVSEVLPFESERCVVRIDSPDKEQKKLERRQKIALEAAKQCGRGKIPAVARTLRFDAMLERAAKSRLKLFFYEGDGTEPLARVLETCEPHRLEAMDADTDIAIIIGAEGGFTLAEVERAREQGFILCGLGKRILRCETASGFVLACLAYRFEL